MWSGHGTCAGQSSCGRMQDARSMPVYTTLTPPCMSTTPSLTGATRCNPLTHWLANHGQVIKMGDKYDVSKVFVATDDDSVVQYIRAVYRNWDVIHLNLDRSNFHRSLVAPLPSPPAVPNMSVPHTLCGAHSPTSVSRHALFAALCCSLLLYVSC